MRIYLTTTANIEPVPYNYQASLVGALHKWLGANEEHDRISLYSLSWLYNGRGGKSGLSFPEGGGFFISSPSEDFIVRVVKGIQRDPVIRYGMRVREVGLCQTPNFGEQCKFILQSPVLIKRKVNEEIKFYYPSDNEADLMLTETLRNKMRKLGLKDIPVHVRFDRSYENIKTRLVTYKGIDNKATFCPVIIEGDPAALAFAWDVGVGNSTGIGFGALK